MRKEHITDKEKKYIEKELKERSKHVPSILRFLDREDIQEHAHELGYQGWNALIEEQASSMPYMANIKNPMGYLLARQPKKIRQNLIDEASKIETWGAKKPRLTPQSNNRLYKALDEQSKQIDKLNEMMTNLLKSKDETHEKHPIPTSTRGLNPRLSAPPPHLDEPKPQEKKGS